MTATTVRPPALEPSDTHDWHFIEGSEYDRVNVALWKRMDDLNIDAASVISWLTFHEPATLDRVIDEFEAAAATA